MRLLPLLLTSFVLLPGCPGSSSTDTGGTDGGGLDTGGTDTGGVDTGGLDAPATDTGGTDTDTGGTDTGGIDLCTLTPPLDNGCATDANCIVTVHQTDCCGNEASTGANHSERDRFDAFEAACRASLPMCDCPVGPISTDSGETTMDETAIQVACVARGPRNVCLTYVTTRPLDAP